MGIYESFFFKDFDYNAFLRENVCDITFWKPESHFFGQIWIIKLITSVKVESKYFW